mmetsp:Transcript_37688/g.44934  ORF Transcript_37688/g.44934 Transcript_37688/m.44934 type:complete len:202 (-) Transcript_37688:109-714(-)
MVDGRFVAPRSNTPSEIEPSTPSISFKNVDKTRASAVVPLPIPWSLPLEEEEDTIESISSKKSTQGEAERANANARLTTASASPTYDEEYTSAGEREMNAIFAAPAAARASFVLPHPGGPWSNMPRGGTSPNLANCFAFVCGHSIARRRAVFAPPTSPAISSHRVSGGALTADSRSADAPTSFIACRSSSIVILELPSCIP